MCELLYFLRNEEKKKPPEMLSSLELEILKDILPVLSPLEELTKDLSGQKYCTCSMVIPAINCLRNGLMKSKRTTRQGETNNADISGG